MDKCPPQENFYFWGSWGGRRIQEPVLAKKIPRQFKKVMLGEGYIIGLTDENKVVSWGKDTKNGCLGLGEEEGKKITKQDQPRELDGLNDIADVQIGPTHVVALNRQGEVWCWGNGEKGQLGQVRTKPLFKPEQVQALAAEKIKQIAVVRNSNFALTQDGRVYAWGENDQNFLALSDSRQSLPQVAQPTCLSAFGDRKIQRLEVFEHRIIVAHLCSGGEEGPCRKPAAAEEGPESERFRELLAKMHEFYRHLVRLKHGQPYDLPSDAGDARITSYAGLDEDRNADSIDEDRNADVEKIQQAERHLAALHGAACELLKKHQYGGQNSKLVLCMFIDECRLRREKVLRTLQARQLIDARRVTPQAMPWKADRVAATKAADRAADKATAIEDRVTTPATYDADDARLATYGASNEVRKIVATTGELESVQKRVGRVEPVELVGMEFKKTLEELLECRKQLNDTQVEVLKEKAAEHKSIDLVLPALRIIKERWDSLKRCSLYALYHEWCETKDLDYGGDDSRQLAYLVKLSNNRIDEILQKEEDQMVTHDTLVPQLCYGLLRENAELRKMSNSYQLHVMMLHQGKKVDGAHLEQANDGALAVLEH